MSVGHFEDTVGNFNGTWVSHTVFWCLLALRREIRIFVYTRVVVLFFLFMLVTGDLSYIFISPVCIMLSSVRCMLCDSPIGMD